MSISFTPLTPVFAAECSGVDISKPLTPDEIATIDEGMDRYAVLVFHRETPLSTPDHIAFTKQFGDLEAPYTQIRSRDGGSRLGSPNLSDVSNLGGANQILDHSDRKRLFSLGNQLWHSDSSYKVIPARYSMLCAHVIPPEGGNTEFADMRAAYDMLDAKTKALVEDLVCEHSRIFSKGALGFPFTEEEQQAFAPVRQRLVRTHRKTGRKSLYLSSHAGRIIGWETPEALLLLRELMEHATQREFVYSHKWTIGDLVVWDNRTVTHRARRYEDQKYPRDLRRTTLTDGVPTVAQQPVATAVAAE
ncbi:MAG TPA: TauD/TfdA family dioxygenase [Stellaceae bacterium]|jgi:alpha-ketoglutarate-dependent 2,4-dichlorophenoxyacetate dioxygenase|nr:TauD/TfdA family dioxygenase [Stellaceae bacterium]